MLSLRCLGRCRGGRLQTEVVWKRFRYPARRAVAPAVCKRKLATASRSTLGTSPYVFMAATSLSVPRILITRCRL